MFVQARVLLMSSRRLKRYFELLEEVLIFVNKVIPEVAKLPYDERLFKLNQCSLNKNKENATKKVFFSTK